jgi:HK97 gp10 family phage protein
MSFRITNNVNKISIETTKNFKAKSKNLDKVFDRFVIDAKTRAKSNIERNNSVDNGTLRDSIKIKKRKTRDTKKWKIIVDSIHGAFVEFGTRKRYNAPSSLSSYANSFKGMKGEGGDVIKRLTDYFKRKNFDNDRIQIAIMDVLTNGTRPHPFFFPAVWYAQRKLPRKIRKALKKRR